MIAEALRWSTRQKTKLENLHSWITVATPFLAFKKQKRLFSRVKRRYQLLLAIITAYILAVLLAVPIGMCTDGIGDKRECWVEKSHSRYFDFDNLKTVHADLSYQESKELPMLGVEHEGNLDIATDVKSRGESGSLVQDNYKRPVVRDINLIMYSRKGNEAPSINKAASFNISVVDANFTKPEYWPPGIANRMIQDTYVVAKGEKLANDFKQFARIKHDALGRFPLDICAPANLEIFALVEPPFRPLNFTPEKGNDFATTGVIDPPELWSEGQDNYGSTYEIYSETFAYNKTINQYDYLAFSDECARAKNGQNIDKKIENWGKSVGLKTLKP